MKRSISLVMLVFCLIIVDNQAFCKVSIALPPGCKIVSPTRQDQPLPGPPVSGCSQVASRNEVRDISPVDLKKHWIAIGNRYPNAAILHKAVMLDIGKRMGAKVRMRFNNTYPWQTEAGKEKGRARKAAFVPSLEINYFYPDGSTVFLWEVPRKITRTSEWARVVKRKSVPADEIHSWHSVTAPGFGTLPFRLQKKKGAGGYYSADSAAWMDGVFVLIVTLPKSEKWYDVATAKAAFGHALSMLRVVQR